MAILMVDKIAPVSALLASLKSKRGGKRPGAGRKPKALTEATKPAPDAPAEIKAIGFPESNDPASQLASSVYSALKEILDDNAQPASARVSAARAIIGLARAERGTAAVAGGKKDQQQSAADQRASSGRFQSPPPPRPH